MSKMEDHQKTIPNGKILPLILHWKAYCQRLINAGGRYSWALACMHGSIFLKALWNGQKKLRRSCGKSTDPINHFMAGIYRVRSQVTWEMMKTEKKRLYISLRNSPLMSGPLLRINR